MRAIAKREAPFHQIPKSQTILMVEQEILGDEGFFIFYLFLKLV